MSMSSGPVTKRGLCAAGTTCVLNGDSAVLCRTLPPRVSPGAAVRAEAARAAAGGLG